MSHGGPYDDDTAHGDVAPGTMSMTGSHLRKGVQGYLLGLAAASLLTLASFLMARSHILWGPSIPMALVALAIAQIGVHLVFFLHLTTAPDNTNNILALAFGVLIVALLVGGSIWIMQHLNQNMLPMNEIMQMQR